MNPASGTRVEVKGQPTSSWLPRPKVILRAEARGPAAEHTVNQQISAMSTWFSYKLGMGLVAGACHVEFSERSLAFD